MTVSAARRQEIIERRMLVSQLRLSGFRRQDKIAEQLGVHKSTISRDFAILDEMYTQRASDDIAIAKGVDLERVDELIFAVWSRAKAGNIQAIDAVRALLDKRAKLLGLNAPLRQELRIPDGLDVTVKEAEVDLSQLTDEQLVQLQDLVGAIVAAQELTAAGTK